MSDILIKGLEMPKEGCHHTLSIYSDGSVEIGSKNNYIAIELPPHGDLIARDALMDRHNNFKSVDGRIRTVVELSDIENAPTVLEASE